MCKKKTGVKMRDIPHSHSQVFILFYRHQSPKCLFNFFLVYIIYYLLKCLLLSAGANRSETVWFAKFRRVDDQQSIPHSLLVDCICFFFHFWAPEVTWRWNAFFLHIPVRKTSSNGIDSIFLISLWLSLTILDDVQIVFLSLSFAWF